MTHTDLAQNVEAVHLVEELHQGSLDLTISRCALREPGHKSLSNFIHLQKMFSDHSKINSGSYRFVLFAIKRFKKYI